MDYIYFVYFSVRKFTFLLVSQTYLFNYYKLFSIVDKKPTIVVTPPGGILADEMGLGKTVEVLACLLLNLRTDFPEWTPNFCALSGIEKVMLILIHRFL